MLNLVFIIVGYLCGSVNFAIIVCKLARLPDPRAQGSGNPGATNVLRLAGKKLALLVIVGDALKGVLPVLLARICGVHSEALSLVALFAVLGHMYPVFFRFQGGKGVATTLGAILALSWSVGLAVLGTWVVMAAVFRFSSLASLVAIVLLPVYILLWSVHSFVLPMILLAVVVVYQHRGNIKRLLKREEPKIGKKKKA
jgi:glycerol-3-phosphate acyltransferase PlsY